MMQQYETPQWLKILIEEFSEKSTPDVINEINLYLANNKHVDFEQIKFPFLLIILDSVIDKFDHEKFPQVLHSIDQVRNLLINNEQDTDIGAAARAAAYDYFAEQLLILIKNCK